MLNASEGLPQLFLERQKIVAIYGFALFLEGLICGDGRPSARIRHLEPIIENFVSNLYFELGKAEIKICQYSAESLDDVHLKCNFVLELLSKDHDSCSERFFELEFVRRIVLDLLRLIPAR